MSTNEEDSTGVAVATSPAISRRKTFASRTPEWLWMALSDAPKHIGWDKNAVVYKMILSEHAGGWRSIIKARRGKEMGVAFLQADTYAQLLELLTLKIADGDLLWRSDKFPG